MSCIIGVCPALIATRCPRALNDIHAAGGEVPRLVAVEGDVAADTR